MDNGEIKNMKLGTIALAIILAVCLLVSGLSAYMLVTGWNVKNGEQGPNGEVGPQGLQGPVGATGPKGDIGLTGLKGDTGDIGPKGATGATGPQGSAGIDGQDLVCTPPIIKAHTMDGLVPMCDPWIFSITVDHPTDDIACTDDIKVEMYLYVNTSWDKWMINKITLSELWYPKTCLGYNYADFKGDHFWYPIYNEVGEAGDTFSFDWSATRDVLGQWGFLTPCEKFTWRVDITDCGCFTSDTYTFQPDCNGYGGCGPCCWICSAMNYRMEYPLSCQQIENLNNGLPP
jgi:hypothetical protein